MLIAPPPSSALFPYTTLFRSVRLGYAQSNFNEISKCQGILLTGGEDVHPRFYNRQENLTLCDDDIDEERDELDRKSTRLNSSHRCISYAVFCLKKKIKINNPP